MSDENNTPVEQAKQVLVSTRFEGYQYSLRTTPIKGGWTTTLLMGDIELTVVNHSMPIYKEEKKRDTAFAKRIMIELGKTNKDKYLRPIYEIIKSAIDKKDELDSYALELKKSESEAAEKARKEEEEKHIREKEEYEEERRRKESEKNKAKNEHTIRKIQLYEKLCNKDGTVTPQEIDAARRELRKLMMPEFWGVEGFNEKTGNPGHLSLKKLPIADYIQKAFNIVRFGGRNWWYDWDRAFYTYDAEDVLINQEIANIMEEVGDGRDYVYNGNIISDKAQIIEKASMKRVYVDNPFNKVKNVINARNGVLKLDYDNRKVDIIGKKPDYMFSYCIDTIYDENADPGPIDRELEKILGPVQKELIYQIAALAIRDTDPDLAPSKIAYIFFGKPNTGKNTVQDLLLRFFGGRVVSHIPLHEIIENKFVKPLLEGKLLNLDDELPSSLNKSESREIKSLTGGKTHTLEPKNVKPYEGIITTLMIFAGNQFPKCSIAKSEAAFWERWDIVNFEHQFTVNEKFTTDLYSEQNMSGFFRKVIDKLFDIHDKGIKRNIRKVSIYSEWMSSSSNVYQFIQETTIESSVPVDYVKDELFAYYN
jgi:phage/plasmid-associated DNA primase